MARSRKKRLYMLTKFTNGDDGTKKYLKFRRSKMDFYRYSGYHSLRVSGVPVKQKISYTFFHFLNDFTQQMWLLSSFFEDTHLSGRPAGHFDLTSVKERIF